MSRDYIHFSVLNALRKGIWNITEDPMTVKTRGVKILIDLAAERLILAEKENQKIAIEIKSFLNLSLLHDFYKALGQYLCYRYALKKFEKERMLYLAISSKAWRRLKAKPFFTSMQLILIITSHLPFQFPLVLVLNLQY